jgi:hypothetical protein
MTLDSESWQGLKTKALNHYKDHRRGQTKQGFFNQLNEAFAYRQLLRRGCESIRFIEEGNGRKPDICYFQDRVQRYCEVKTIGISDDEFQRRSLCNRTDPQDKRFWNNGEQNLRLSCEFFKKLLTDLNNAKEHIFQMSSGEGLVYIVINFDDFTTDYYGNYRNQLISFCRQNNFADVFMKIGVTGRRMISPLRARTGAA